MTDLNRADYDRFKKKFKTPLEQANALITLNPNDRIALRVALMVTPSTNAQSAANSLTWTYDNFAQSWQSLSPTERLAIREFYRRQSGFANLPTENNFVNLFTSGTPGQRGRIQLLFQYLLSRTITYDIQIYARFLELSRAQLEFLMGDMVAPSSDNSLRFTSPRSSPFSNSPPPLAGIAAHAYIRGTLTPAEIRSIAGMVSASTTPRNVTPYVSSPSPARQPTPPTEIRQPTPFSSDTPQAKRRRVRDSELTVASDRTSIASNLFSEFSLVADTNFQFQSEFPNQSPPQQRPFAVPASMPSRLVSNPVTSTNTTIPPTSNFDMSWNRSPIPQPASLDDSDEYDIELPTTLTHPQLPVFVTPPRREFAVDQFELFPGQYRNVALQQEFEAAAERERELEEIQRESEITEVVESNPAIPIFATALQPLVKRGGPSTGVPIGIPNSPGMPDYYNPIGQQTPMAQRLIQSASRRMRRSLGQIRPPAIQLTADSLQRLARTSAAVVTALGTSYFFSESAQNFVRDVANRALRMGGEQARERVNELLNENRIPTVNDLRSIARDAGSTIANEVASSLESGARNTIQRIGSAAVNQISQNAPEFAREVISDMGNRAVSQAAQSNFRQGGLLASANNFAARLGPGLEHANPNRPTASRLSIPGHVHTESKLKTKHLHQNVEKIVSSDELHEAIDENLQDLEESELHSKIICRVDHIEPIKKQTYGSHLISESTPKKEHIDMLHGLVDSALEMTKNAKSARLYPNLRHLALAAAAMSATKGFWETDLNQKATQALQNALQDLHKYTILEHETDQIERLMEPTRIGKDILVKAHAIANLQARTTFEREAYDGIVQEAHGDRHVVTEQVVEKQYVEHSANTNENIIDNVKKEIVGFNTGKNVTPLTNIAAVTPTATETSLSQSELLERQRKWSDIIGQNYINAGLDSEEDKMKDIELKLSKNFPMRIFTDTVRIVDDPFNY